MIDGIKFHVTTDEVREKIDVLIQHRERRFKAVEKELIVAARRPVDEYQERIEKSLDERGGESYEGGRPRPDPQGFKDSVVHNLKVTLDSHRATIERLKFMRDHIVPNETFRVNWMELGHLFPDSRDHGHFPVCFGHQHDEVDEDGLDYFGPPKVVIRRGDGGDERNP